jgi:hypothetical protein
MRTERLVLCGGAAPPPGSDGAKALRLALDGPDRNVTVRLHDIAKRLVADVPDLLVDLLEVAAYVYSADWGTGRGGEVQQKLGEGWRRRFHFVIPVRDPDAWNDPDVRDALNETLGFLSEDDYRFDFVARQRAPGIQPYLEYNDAAERASFQPDEVILFSGGLDSLAGVVETVVGEGRSTVLVSHHSSTKIVARQRQLVGELKGMAPSRLFHVPVKVDKKGKIEKEFTLRSRSFLFASLAMVIGRMFGRTRVRFFENGVVSLNLPILPQIVGARATRTTHPQALAGFGRIFSALLDDDITVDNPFAFRTKAEVVRTIEDRGCGDLIRTTVSCTHVRNMTNYKTHCGVCSQCIDRRFGVLAAGLGGRDPEEMYAVRLLQDERRKKDDRTMAEGYARSALEIRRMNDHAFLGKYAGELSRAVGYLPGAADGNAKALFDLHKRHAEGVFSVLAEGVSAFAADIVDGKLPPHSLLKMAVAPGGGLGVAPAALPPMEAVDSAGTAPADEGRMTNLRIALDAERQQVLVEGLAPLKGGKTFALLEVLAGNYRLDQAAGRAPEKFTLVLSGALAAELQTEEPSLRKLISRISGRLYRDFEARYGVPLPKNALIENTYWQGYRLNPTVRLLDASQLRKS